MARERTSGADEIARKEGPASRARARAGKASAPISSSVVAAAASEIAIARSRMGPMYTGVRDARITLSRDDTSDPAAYIPKSQHHEGADNELENQRHRPRLRGGHQPRPHPLPRLARGRLGH